jgi:hypothetical protein
MQEDLPKIMRSKKKRLDVLEKELPKKRKLVQRNKEKK